MRILLNWYYHRADLTAHLAPLAEEAELVFIDRHAPDGVAPPAGEVIYWGDFATPDALLDAVRPDLVVFSDIEAFHQLALNIAARNRGLPTCVLQHGLQYALSAADAAAEARPVKVSATSGWSARFLFSALRPRNLAALPPLLRFIYERKRYPLGAALKRNPFELRRADRYIEFSPANARFHVTRDGVPEDRFILTGNPSYDDFLARVDDFAPKGEYALLVDTPFLEASMGPFPRMTAAQKEAYLRKLARLAAARGLRLVVKLHPLSFQAALPADDNITYVRQGDLARLAGEAEFVIVVHFATLTPPMIHKKPYFYFAHRFSQTPPMAAELGLDGPDLTTFEPEALGEPAAPMDWTRIGEHIHAADGGAGARIRAALLDMARGGG